MSLWNKDVRPMLLGEVEEVFDSKDYLRSYLQSNLGTSKSTFECHHIIVYFCFLKRNNIS